MRLLWLAVLAVPPQDVHELKLGDRTFRGTLLFEDAFATLDRWSVEGKGAAAADRNSFLWDCSGTGEGTAWCRQRFEGPTLVTYEVEVLEGRDNVNFIAYARLDRDGRDVLLETERTGEYGEYHTFPNYLLTYLRPEPGDSWRLRFRRNPRFKLLSESFFKKAVKPGDVQKIAAVFERDGTIGLYVDGAPAHSFKDPEPLPRSGYHGLRTWRTKLRYRNFRVYGLPRE